MSAYRIAIDHTTRTIDHRAQYYRNLIAGVIVVSVSCIGWVAVARTLPPLSSLSILFPVCGLFFFLDGRLLNDWRSQLFRCWACGDLDFRALRDAACAIPTLPKETLQSMLATLPSAGDLVTEQGISPSTREAVAAVVTAIYACRCDAIGIKAVGYTVSALCLVVAAALRTWPPLFGMFALVPLPLLRHWSKARRLATSRATALTAQRQPDFDREEYLRLVVDLDWEPISASEREEFLGTVPPIL